MMSNKTYNDLLHDALRAVLVSKNAKHIVGSELEYSELADLPEGTLKGLLEDIVIASEWKEDVLEALDLVYAHSHNARENSLVAWKTLNHHLHHGTTKIYLYQGDITTLNTDAIVNAANEGGCGCYVPSHRCIDNVIHRRSGPRLRHACRKAMNQRGSLLSAGTTPLVTEAFNLPAEKIIHVTGPQIKGSPTKENVEQLAASYRNSLDACVKHHLKSIAFCCISTGLFGYPKTQACEIAMNTVFEWIHEHPNQLDAIVFNVFTDEDYEIYKTRLDNNIQSKALAPSSAPSALGLRERKLAFAKKAICDADAVLICAGAGMSVKEGEMVYTNPKDFEKHYPWFVKWGYRTSYEVMGLGSDPNVPDCAKWALHAKHMDDMRWGFTPNNGYSQLLDLVKEKDYFVLTSNVDACFERAGFSSDRIYTPQGEWTYYQCMKPCRTDAVFESRPLLDKVVPLVGSNGMLPEGAVPCCSFCGGKVFGNVRGGSWFLHSKYDQQNDSIRQWMKNVHATNKKVVIIEVGAGFNTPTVTRFPMESFARDMGKQATFLRINPTDNKVPEDLPAISFKEGWQVLNEIANARPDKEVDSTIAKQYHLNDTTSIEEAEYIASYFGHFNWNRFLLQLKS